MLNLPDVGEEADRAQANANDAVRQQLQRRVHHMRLEKPAFGICSTTSLLFANYHISCTTFLHCTMHIQNMVFHDINLLPG